MEDIIYLLFDGSSCDGRGEPKYSGRTYSKEEAIKHYQDCKNNPYSFGKVMILTESTFSPMHLSLNNVVK